MRKITKKTNSSKNIKAKKDFAKKLLIGLVTLIILILGFVYWEELLKITFLRAQQNAPGIFESESIPGRTGNIQEQSENGIRYIRLVADSSGGSSPSPSPIPSGASRNISINLTRPETLSVSNSGYQIVPTDGQVLSGQGWVTTSPNSKLKIILGRGFGGNDGGAIELDVSNFDYSALSGDKQNIMTLYSWDHNGDGNNDNFKYIRSLWTFRIGRNYTSDSYGHFALKGKAGTSETYWENKATVPGGTWQASRTYTIRMEWDSGTTTSRPTDGNGVQIGDPSTEVRLLINGQLVSTRQRMDFGGRSLSPEHQLKYLYIGDDMDRPDSTYTAPYVPGKLIRFREVRVFYN